MFYVNTTERVKGFRVYCVSLSTLNYFQIRTLQNTLQNQSSIYDSRDVLKSEISRYQETISKLRKDLLQVQEAKDNLQTRVTHTHTYIYIYKLF